MIRKVVPRLAQGIAPISCSGMDDNRSSQKGHVARDLVTSAFRQSRVQRVEVSCHCTSRNPEPEALKAPKGGPTISRSSLSHPSKGDTWCVIRLPAFSPIVISKRKKQLPHIPDARSDESFQGPGPTTTSGEFRTVRFRGACGARLSHLSISIITISRSMDQPLHICERRKNLWE